jgi:cobalt-precorrin-5B (C1)-methyltransferase
MSQNSEKCARERKNLRKGFSTGTAATAAARAALRLLMSGRPPSVVAVRLPNGVYYPIEIKECSISEYGARAVVIKNAGDDPDVTHKAEIVAVVRSKPSLNGGFGSETRQSHGPSGILLIAGEGVGTSTKAGLPIAIGEPAINPVPRAMLTENLIEEWDRWSLQTLEVPVAREDSGKPVRSHVFLPIPEMEGRGLNLEVEISVPKGAELARHTLNPRLGIMGGISILGTTGLVKPFSHKAYEETIEAALNVAAANGCTEVVLSTGGKSEHYAQTILPGHPVEAFVQIADFFGYAVGESVRKGFTGIVHSAFFGKVVKMAQGHHYTHAHRVAQDLRPLARLAGIMGYPDRLCREVAEANTAREALDILLANSAMDVIEAAAWEALEQSSKMADGKLSVRLLLFNYDGSLLADLRRGPHAA